MATYGPGIDQSQHAKSVSHIIKLFIVMQNPSNCESSFSSNDGYLLALLLDLPSDFTCFPSIQR